MKCGMSVQAEHLNVFDGRKVMCLLDSIYGLIAHLQFLKLWGNTGMILQNKSFTSTFVTRCVGAAKLSKDEG